MEKIRKIVRKQLFRLLENYPMGTVNDPSAPWNQGDTKYVDVKTPEKETFEPIYFNNEITILKNKEDGSNWFYYNDSAKKEDYFPYSGAEDLSQFIGNNEDGQPSFDEEYGDWDLDGQIVSNYVNDNLINIEKGEGVDAYEGGIDLVKIDEPLAVELDKLYKDTNLRKVLFIS